MKYMFHFTNMNAILKCLMRETLHSQYDHDDDDDRENEPSERYTSM